MIFKNGIYDKLKWFCMKGFPAIITFIGILGETLEWDITTKLVIILGALNTLFGVFLGISNNAYKREYSEASGDLDE